jgi:hypothetical protein
MKSKSNKKKQDPSTFDPGKSKVAQDANYRQVGLQVLLTVLKKYRKPK